MLEYSTTKYTNVPEYYVTGAPPSHTIIFDISISIIGEDFTR